MWLFDWFRKTPSSRFTPVGGDLDPAIESVAVLIDDQVAFRAKAMEVARRYGPNILSQLQRRFHRTTPPPPGFTVPERGLTGWLSCWQFAIFEIIYQYREHAIPMLRKVAFGEYDWTQANAIELLCRLAAVDIDRDRTLADLKRAMPEMRDTALEYVAGTLLQQAKGDPAMAAILAELRQVEEFGLAVEAMREDDLA